MLLSQQFCFLVRCDYIWYEWFGRLYVWEYTDIRHEYRNLLLERCGGIFWAMVYFLYFRDLNSIQEKYMVAKFPILIFDSVKVFFLYLFGSFYGYFLSSVSLLFAHLRKIHARENFGWPFTKNTVTRRILSICNNLRPWELVENGSLIRDTLYN